MKKLADITEMADYFFAEKLNYDKKLLVWKEMRLADVKEALLLCDKTLAELGKWDMKKMEKELVAVAEKFNQERFESEIKEFIARSWQEFSGKVLKF